jgi:SAM-dependent methyltransferase
VGAQASHLDGVRDDLSYAKILAGWDAAFYDRFVAALRPECPGDSALDVGCGVGQVVVRLAADGYDARGVDVAEANIAASREFTDRCSWYDGGKLPFPDASFSAVGALNVLEHVQDPEAFLGELVRVARPGAKIVVSSPNFLRAFGWNDYHPRMRGLGNKWRNFLGLLQRRRQMARNPESVRFERMTPIIKTPFTPDDDAIVCTNGLEIAFFLTRLGCESVRVSCVDRVISPLVEFVLDATPARFGMFNAFVTARRR